MRDLVRVADRRDVAAVEQHRAVAVLLDRAHVVGDEDDRAVRAADLVEDVACTSAGRRRRRPRAPRRSAGCRRPTGSSPRTRAAPASPTSSSSASGRRTPRARRTRSPRRAAPRPRSRDRPIITPLRITFSRAVSSTLKPTPSSMNGATRPAIRIVPASARVDAGEDLQQRALAGAVAPDDAEELAPVDVEGDVVERVQLARTPGCANGCRTRSLIESTRCERDLERLREVADLDHDRPRRDLRVVSGLRRR